MKISELLNEYLTLETDLVNNREMWFVPVVNPDGSLQDSATATGVWTLVEQFTFHKASLWPSVMSRGVCFGGTLRGENRFAR